jgi:nucleotidyltransferase/DNA polymerase involved in DNA repair
VAADDTPRGAVIASSYEAKALGIKLGLNVREARLLSAQEVADRVCAYMGCSHEPHLAIADQAA